MEYKKQLIGRIESFYVDVVEEFKEACKKLNIKQSDVIRKAMQKTIDQANK